MPIELPRAPAAHLVDRWRLIMTGLGAIAAFVAVIQYSLLLKIFIGLGVLALWGIFELITQFNQRFINKLWRGAHRILGTPDVGELKPADKEGLVLSARWLSGGILVAILMAAGFKGLEVRFTPPRPPASSFIYSMVVLDASEGMNLPFAGSVSKWAAVEDAFQDYFRRANDDSKYGLIVIGGQNPQEHGNDICGIPSVPLLPLMLKDGHGDMVLSEDLSLDTLQSTVSVQSPAGRGSLSRAFFLAKNQLEDLPIDPNIKRIIVLIASASDGCQGDIDWYDLIDDIRLVNKEIDIHEELILLEENPSPGLLQVVDQSSPAAQPVEDSELYIQVARNQDELKRLLSEIMDRLESHNDSTVQTQTPAGHNTTTPDSPLWVKRTPTRDRQRRNTTSTAGVISITRTSTCTPSPVSTNTLAPLASTEEDRVPASTFTPSPTYTSTSTFTPTGSVTPTIRVYPTDKPTKKVINTVLPPPTDVPPPPPTDVPPTTDPCCKHCTAISQPCGDSCIPLTSTCQVGPGCACKP